MKRKKILITGAGGYIGSILASLFLKSGFEIVAVDNFSSGYEYPLRMLQDKFGTKQLRYCKLDLTKNLNPFFAKEKEIDVVVHCAGCISMDESMKNPQKYFTNNICASQNLISTMIQYDIKKIIFSSSCAVYGKPRYIPLDEKHTLLPLNPYSSSKLIIEQLIEWYCKLQGLKYVIFRYFNVTGATEGGSIGDSQMPSGRLVQNVVRAALGIEPFHLTCGEVNTPDKTVIRDYLNVIDLNTAHFQAIEYLEKGGESVTVNLGGGKGYSILEVIKTVERLSGTIINIEKGIPRKNELSEVVSSIRKAKEVLNWEPKKTLEDSVKSLISWYLGHPNGWDNH